MSVNDYKFDIVSIMNSIGAVSNNNLILVLQDGVAIGRLPIDADLKDENSLINIYEKAFNEYRRSEKQDSPQIIELIDVKYTSGGATINLPFMIFFIDQIVGVSIGLEN